MGSGDLGVPTLTPQTPDAAKSKKHRLVAIISGGVGTTVLVAIVVSIVYFYLMRVRRFSRRRSESGSSQSSSHVELERQRGSPLGESHSTYETQNLRQLTLSELEHATSNFNQSNIIGEGGFGVVYKGLLQDGFIVAIKRRIQGPSLYFVQEVQKIGHISHKHLVKLVGYCQESGQQFLVYDYQLGGNVGDHLYDREGLPIGKLEIRQRLSIALGAAKGLEYLHGLVPPHLHMHFRTSNVLLDGNYISKVADFGLCKLLGGAQRAGSSSPFDCFIDPELSISNGFSEKSDIYGFGVFLLELISGREALDSNQTDSFQNLIEQAKCSNDLDAFLDKTVAEHARTSLRRMMLLALQCVETNMRRPTMGMVVRELELIQEKEIGRQQGVDIGEEIGVVTLGSELFK